MTMRKALHLRDDIDYMYQIEGRGRTSIEDSVDASMRGQEEQRKTNHGDQKHYRQHKDQQNNN